DTTLYLCHPAATDTTVAPAGKSGLFAMVNAPPLPAAGTPEGVKARAAWAEHAAALREECIRRVVELAPELRGKLRVLGERTPLDLEALGAPGGSIYGFLPHGRFGPFKRPKLRGPTPGLFFAGGGTHPGGGVPLVMRSGQFAAAMALDFLGRRAA
ncbi:MAG TPA: phytoene desaturase, partial [Myxococcaceae bacterium]|nr:phytoene desaturase [Myxococcaceae bacterium]